MQGMLRIQDIIGLILAILIVAILISIILILRESARERKLWKEENEDFEEEPKIKKRLFAEKKINFPLKTKAAPPPTESDLRELEKKRKWQNIPHDKELPEREGVRVKKEYTIPAEPKINLEEKDFKSVSSSELLGVTGDEKVTPRIPLIEQKKTQEPRQAILERGLKKIQEYNLDAKNLKINLTEETIDFSPLLWDIKEKIQSGQPMGDIVIHTVFKNIPGLSGEDVIEQYRSGDVSVVEKLEARIRSKEGREFLVASLYLSNFQLPELDRLLRNGTLSNDEYQLLKAFKFVDRTTKKEFARTVYARIVEESTEENG